jgi:hypothetical protein
LASFGEGRQYGLLSKTALQRMAAREEVRQMKNQLNMHRVKIGNGGHYGEFSIPKRRKLQYPHTDVRQSRVITEEKHSSQMLTGFNTDSNTSLIEEGGDLGGDTHERDFHKAWNIDWGSFKNQICTI